ncbi:hypothetical protein [Sphingomonas koreensis]|jgi:hypothetical protein|nr:hypothetical protein [Sphingomonas koreensis]MDC7811453.1 hypothetical protein [Sphingomonas koreensis]
MNRLPPFTAAAAMSAVACIFAAPAMAQDIPSDLRDMVYARAGQAEAELQRRGYVAVRTETGSDRIWTNWWNADRRQCVSIVTRNGRYDSIVTAPAPDCRGGGRPGRPDRPGWDDRPGRPDRPDWDDRPGRPDRPGGWPGGRPISLGLICFGEGQKPAAANRWGWQWNWDSNRYDFGNRTELTTQQFDASVTIQLWDGGGRIRLPRSLIPPIHSGGTNRDGWWDLYDVYQDRSQIRATYRLNGPNKPRVTIDRRSGRINIQGFASYRFRGSCDTIDGARHQRF